ncbi:MAG: hypothetical protein A2Y14_04005 [Verrucomicrobia bacterium GWF2_51_19]|nr:MAG: hypothetical protein A2Y14_04005 [Verrucomicrobia bacterium GWF2_51_19]HCJ11675.1 hypothetical protein [Opitutae bacterium]
MFLIGIIALPWMAAILQGLPSPSLVKRCAAFLGFALPLAGVVWFGIFQKQLEPYTLGWGSAALHFGMPSGFLLLTFLGAIIGLAAWNRSALFRGLLLWVYGATLCLFSSTDFVSFFFYEMTVLPSFLIVLCFGSDNRKSAIEMMLFSLLRSILWGVFFLWIFKQGNDLQALASFDDNLHFTQWSFPLFLLGLGIAYAVPFYTWAPKFYTAAPLPLVWLQLAIRLFIPYIIWQKMGPLFPKSFAYWNETLCFVGMASFVFVMAAAPKNGRVAYLCVAQGGLAIFALTSMGHFQLWFLMQTVGIALLFATSRGPCKGFRALLIGLAILCLLFPGFGPFPGAYAILMAAWQQSLILGIGAAIGLFLTLVNCLKVIRLEEPSA